MLGRRGVVKWVYPDLFVFLRCAGENGKFWDQAEKACRSNKKDHSVKSFASYYSVKSCGGLRIKSCKE